MIKKLLPWLCYLAVLFLCLFNFVQVVGDPIDDAFIDFRYAENLFLGNGLVFNVGEHVEGYTNLLWTLLLALTKDLGVNYREGMPILVGIFTTATVFVAMKLVERETSSLLAGTACGVAVVCTYNIVASFCLGLETSLFSLWITACFFFIFSKSKLAPIWFALCCAGLMTTRAEGMFLALVMSACLAWVRKDKSAYIGAALVLFILGALETWRWSFYHELLPNSVLAKRDGGFIPYDAYWATTKAGLLYIYNGVGWPLLTLTAACLISLILFSWKSLDSGKRRFFIVGAVIIAFGLTVTISAKGDWMPFARLLTPYYALLFSLLLCTAFGAHQLSDRNERKFRIHVILVAVLIAISGYRPFWKAIVGIDPTLPKLACLFKEEYKPGDVFASGVIGALGYYMMPAPLQDMHGLTNAEVAKSPVMASPYGKTVPSVVARWKPTIIHHNYWPYLCDIFKETEEPYVMAKNPELLKTHNFIFVKATNAQRFRARFKRDFDADFTSEEEGMAELKKTFPSGE